MNEKEDSTTMDKNCGEKTGGIVEKNENEIQWNIFFKQVFICSGVWVIYFLTGLGFGAPTVIIAHIKRETNSTIVISEEMASWLSSIFGYSAVPWVFIFCILTRYIGRKKPFALVSVNTISFFVLLYFSTTSSHILISEIMQGINHASNITLSVIIVSEYTSPKYRGVYLAIKSASVFWGVWVANAIGTFFHWKYIPLVGICVSIYPFGVLFWPESPHWLASRGRFHDCRTAFKWIKGASQDSCKELDNLIESQKEYIESNKNGPNKFYNLNNYCTKAFYMPLFLSVMMMLQYHLSGKLVCVIYVIDILKKITGSESTAYFGMLILDGVTIVGMYLGCFTSKFVKRRSMLLYSSGIGITFLFLISFYLYLVRLTIFEENRYLTISLLILFSVSISCGPMIMSTSIFGELTPLRYKSSCTLISAMTFVLFSSTVLKVSPYLFKVLDIHGTFLFYAISSGICTVVLYKYLPETKDKTLQEIEDGFNDSAPTAYEVREEFALEERH